MSENSMMFFTNIGYRIVQSPMIWEMLPKYQSNHIWKSKICRIASQWVLFFYFNVMSVCQSRFGCQFPLKKKFHSFRCYYIHLYPSESAQLGRFIFSRSRSILAEEMSHLPCILILSANLLPKQFRSESRWIFIRLVYDTSRATWLRVPRHYKHLFGELISALIS